jgi:hypothetical protein
MSITTNERPQHPVAIDSAEHNRIVASQWIDAFNARDDAAEVAARTADYIAHAPDSIQTTALDGDAWVEFLGVFVEGFPDLHLEVLDSSADDGMVAQRILMRGRSTRLRGVAPLFDAQRLSAHGHGVCATYGPLHSQQAALNATRARPARASRRRCSLPAGR